MRKKSKKSKKSIKIVGKPGEGQRSPQIARAHELANEMVKKGLCGNDTAAIESQVDKIIKSHMNENNQGKYDKNSVPTTWRIEGKYDRNSDPPIWILEDDTVSEKDIEKEFAKINVKLPKAKKIFLEPKMTSTQKLKAELEEKNAHIETQKQLIEMTEEENEEQVKELNAQISELKTDKMALQKDVVQYVNLLKLAIIGLEGIGNIVVKEDQHSIGSVQSDLEKCFAGRKF